MLNWRTVKIGRLGRASHCQWPPHVTAPSLQVKVDVPVLVTWWVRESRETQREESLGRMN